MGIRDWFKGISKEDRRRYDEEMARRRSTELRGEVDRPPPRPRLPKAAKREARQWLSTTDRPGFASNAFDSEEFQEFVNKLYRAGAKLVVVTNFYEPDYADTIHVTVPKAAAAAVLLVIAKKCPDELDVLQKQGGTETYRVWWD